MNAMFLAVIMAVTVEGLAEYGKGLIEHKDLRCLWIRLGALAVSVALCLLSGADIFACFGVRFAWAPVGSILTGAFASRGANYLNDFIGTLSVPKE